MKVSPDSPEARDLAKTFSAAGRSSQFRLLWVLTLAVAAVLVWSAIHPKDRQMRYWDVECGR